MSDYIITIKIATYDATADLELSKTYLETTQEEAVNNLVKELQSKIEL